MIKLFYINQLLNKLLFSKFNIFVSDETINSDDTSSISYKLILNINFINALIFYLSCSNVVSCFSFDDSSKCFLFYLYNIHFCQYFFKLIELKNIKKFLSIIYNIL